MAGETLQFEFSDEVAALGVRGAYFTITGLANRASDPAFEALAARETEAVLAGLSPDAIRDDPVLAGFRALHEAVGVSNRKNVASPENLLKLLLKAGGLPTVNLVVDIYNLVSLKTRLALGAHDLAGVAGNIRLRLTGGTEGFVPLGAGEAKPVRPGEYAYVDDGNDVLCRLEVRQVEKSKVGLETCDCFYIVQGSAATPPELLRAAAEEVIALTRQFCGGEVRMLHAPWV